MNTNMLSVLLDDSHTYMGLSLERFLEELDKAFQQLKENGDTELLVLPSKCGGACPNNGCGGYAFVGNVSKRHIGIVFEESEHDFIGANECSAIMPEDGQLDAESKLDIISYHTFAESIMLPVNPEIAAACREAVYELLEDDGVLIFEKETYNAWKQRHFALSKSFNTLPMLMNSAYEEFHGIYGNIDYANKILEENALAHAALLEWPADAETNEMAIVRWLIKHEKLAEDVWDNSPHLEKDDITAMKAHHHIGHGLCLKREDFEHQWAFGVRYEEHYYRLEPKYRPAGYDPDKDYGLYEGLYHLSYFVKE